MKRTTPIQALLAILMAVVVLAAQGVAMASPSWVQSVSATNCGCGIKNCCVKASETESTPVPAAPVRTAQESQLQVVLVLAAQLLNHPAPAEITLPSSPFSVPRTATTPLYEWNCSYLI